MAFFRYCVNELLFDLAATASEADPVICGKIQTAQAMTVISWCTYLEFSSSASKAVVGIQIGYCVSDVPIRIALAKKVTFFLKEGPVTGVFQVQSQ